MTDALYRDLMRLAQTDERVAKLMNKHDVAGMLAPKAAAVEPEPTEPKTKKSMWRK